MLYFYIPFFIHPLNDTLMDKSPLWGSKSSLRSFFSDLWSLVGTARDDADFDSSFLGLAECLKKYLLSQQPINKSLEMDTVSYWFFKAVDTA